ncbi:RsmB/NOP family class I SAM-dependent RNA methyltransferase [Donghicola sp. C2-DW-16]|uniref:RsmB/NOP family class I SAM-dependent RNA methyltransferase n=1 Tax=Donghicola mangrovi TaxID=2729614 RepID=A0ABX2PFR5_9RHOB|nr:RsmB/NOP family class I SAM-dependent RNA methyltransferase [Donghicola mangrovi]
MTPTARLLATFDLFCAVDGDKRPVDAVTSGWFRNRRDIPDQDRGDILERLYALLRHRARLTWWLDKHGRDHSPRHQFLAWLALMERKSPEDVSRLFGGPKNAATALTKPEYNLVLRLKGCTIEHPDMPEAVRLECPSWAEQSLRARFGGAFAAEMAATLTPPPVDLRVNPVKATRQDMLQALSDLKLHAEVSPLAPHGIRVSGRFNYARFPALKSGAVEIQDEGSQLVALLVDAQPGDRVVDFCAGAGGKTLAIAAQMNNKGRIIACDVSEGRLKRCSERLRNAGMHNTETRLLASETDKWVKRHKLGFDRVLVDAPCSGTGTWRRNPDTRWRDPEENGLQNLIALQGRILASAARLVKPGGRLVYATCSMLTEENEDQVTAFLAANPAFRLVPLGDVTPDLAAKAQGDTLSLTPARHDTDGFFAAVLQRETTPE